MSFQTNLTTDNNLQGFFARKVDAKLHSLNEANQNNTEQTDRIELAFTEHVKRQVDLVSNIKESLDILKTTVEDTIVQELNKLKKGK